MAKTGTTQIFFFQNPETCKHKNKRAAYKGQFPAVVCVDCGGYWHARPFKDEDTGDCRHTNKQAAHYNPKHYYDDIIVVCVDCFTYVEADLAQDVEVARRKFLEEEDRKRGMDPSYGSRGLHPGI